MNKEEFEEGINGQWINWKFEAENNKRIYEELQRRIERALVKINNMFDEGNEKAIVDDLLILEKILKGESNE